MNETIRALTDVLQVADRNDVFNTIALALGSPDAAQTLLNAANSWLTLERLVEVTPVRQIYFWTEPEVKYQVDVDDPVDGGDEAYGPTLAEAVDAAWGVWEGVVG
jgi:hypothetical protein